MRTREAATYHWRAYGGTRRYHAVGANNIAVCGLMRPWSRTAYAVSKANTCPTCWKQQGAPREMEAGR